MGTDIQNHVNPFLNMYVQKCHKKCVTIIKYQ